MQLILFVDRPKSNNFPKLLITRLQRWLLFSALFHILEKGNRVFNNSTPFCVCDSLVSVRSFISYLA